MTTPIPTDWYIPADNPDAFVAYPRELGRQPWQAMARELLRRAVDTPTHQTFYRVECDGHVFRGNRQNTVHGDIHVLRLIPKEVPAMEALGLPGPVVRVMLHPGFAANGGLLVVSGAPGHGKSTTCAALVRQRVLRHGAFCLTVEDPPEFPLHGDYSLEAHKDGKVIQVPVDDGDFASSIAQALRCFPSQSGHSMLLVGEVLDAATARQVLMAALHGQLVVTTLHAGDCQGALDRILTMAISDGMGRDEALHALAHSLRGVIHQTLLKGTLTVDSLFSAGSNTVVANHLKTGQIRLLSTELETQRQMMKNSEYDFINRALKA